MGRSSSLERLGQGLADLEVQFVVFQDAGPGDEREALEHSVLPPRPRPPLSHRSRTRRGSRSRRRGGRRRSAAASTKEAKRGWGRVGRLFSSGWNWHPTNQGWLGISIISTSCPSGESPLKAIPCSSKGARYSLLNSYRWRWRSLISPAP